MRKSPGRIARPLCLLMALGFCVAAVIALVVGGTRQGEMAAAGLQMAVALALLAVMWTLVGIMFTLARPGAPTRAAGVTPQHAAQAAPAAEAAPAELKHVNWFQKATAATSSQG